MKIYIDARMINMSGIGRYIRNIINNNKYIQDITTLSLKTDEIKYDVNSDIKFNSKIYGIKEQIKFPYIKIKNKSILHVPHYNIPLLYKGRLITTIHDITHILFPEYLPNKFALYYAKFMIKMALKKSDYILTVSQNTKKDLVKYFNADPQKIVVTYNGVEDTFKPKNSKYYEYLYDRYNISKDKKILLYVGNKKPHKNLKNLIKAISLLKNKENYILILSGKGFDGYDELEKMSKDMNLENQIIHTGIVSDEELIDLYNLADLFVFPSLYEGFGIPVLEAMACGTPVICSNTSSLPEVVEDAAYMFDPHDITQIKNSIELLMSDRILYLDLINKGYIQSSKFTWDRCREMTEIIYNKIL